MTAKLSEGRAFQFAKKIGDRYAPEPVYELTRKSILTCKYYPRKFKEKIDFTLYQLDLKDLDSIYTDNYYRKRQQGKHREAARSSSKAIYNEFNPDSVIDFGCGIGHYLERLYENGADIYGIDGHSAAKKYSQIPKDNIEVADLTEYNGDLGSFEVGLCLEVLEHIPEQDADRVVKLIVDFADLLIISAATPGQEGKHHVNEKPKHYWIIKFESKGVEFDEELTEEFKDCVRIDDVRLDNLLIFRGGVSE